MRLSVAVCALDVHGPCTCFLVCTSDFAMHVLVSYTYLYMDKLFGGELSLCVGGADRVAGDLPVPALFAGGRVSVPPVTTRPRVVPLRTLGSSYRSTPLG